MVEIRNKQQALPFFPKVTRFLFFVHKKNKPKKKLKKKTKKNKTPKGKRRGIEKGEEEKLNLQSSNPLRGGEGERMMGWLEWGSMNALAFGLTLVVNYWATCTNRLGSRAGDVVKAAPTYVDPSSLIHLLSWLCVYASLCLFVYVGADEREGTHQVSLLGPLFLFICGAHSLWLATLSAKWIKLSFFFLFWYWIMVVVLWGCVGGGRKGEGEGEGVVYSIFLSFLSLFSSSFSVSSFTSSLGSSSWSSLVLFPPSFSSPLSFSFLSPPSFPPPSSPLLLYQIAFQTGPSLHFGLLTLSFLSYLPFTLRYSFSYLLSPLPSSLLLSLPLFFFRAVWCDDICIVIYCFNIFGVYLEQSSRLSKKKEKKRRRRKGRGGEGEVSSRLVADVCLVLLGVALFDLVWRWCWWRL